MPRVAILGTPRSGNMWLRRLLVTALGSRELSADTPGAVPWDELPEDVVLQLHWPPNPDLEARLDAYRFTSAVVTRHPLDVLVSILQFAQSEPRTARWLNGAGGNELSLIDADPTSGAFAAYAVSERAERLLELTPAWRADQRPTASLRYEDLVANPEAELERLLVQLSVEPRATVTDIVAANTLSGLRSETGSRHFWRGHPGHWRALVPARIAEAVSSVHEAAFLTGGYDADADAALDEDEARARWRELLAEIAPARPPERPSAERIELHAAAHGTGIATHLFGLALRRMPDERAAHDVADQLARNTLSPASLLHDLVTSTEGRVIRLVDDTLAFARWARANGERPREIDAPVAMPEWAVGATWALARTPEGSDVLDIGTAFADEAFIAALQELTTRSLTLVDAAGSEVGDSVVNRADVRSLPFEPASFDVVLCLNTLHHVGADNRSFGLSAERDPESQNTALASLRRVVRRDGRVLVSVPCGSPADLGIFTIRTTEEWLDRFERADFFIVEREVYELTRDGWLSRDEPFPTPEYGVSGIGAGAILCAELSPGRARQAARRALSRATRPVRRTTRQ